METWKAQIEKNPESLVGVEKRTQADEKSGRSMADRAENFTKKALEDGWTVKKNFEAGKRDELVQRCGPERTQAIICHR